MKDFELEDKFDEFMRQCFPDVEQLDTQWRESRRVFHAGATVVLFRLLALTELRDHEALAGIDELRKQIESFFDKAGEDKD